MLLSALSSKSCSITLVSWLLCFPKSELKAAVLVLLLGNVFSGSQALCAGCAEESMLGLHWWLM